MNARRRHYFRLVLHLYFETNWVLLEQGGGAKEEDDDDVDDDDGMVGGVFWKSDVLACAVCGTTQDGMGMRGPLDFFVQAQFCEGRLIYFQAVMHTKGWQVTFARL